MNKWGSDASTYAKIQKYFNTCTLPKSNDEVQNLINEINDSLGTMAQVNYPYDTNFTRFLPGNPVKTACTKGAVTTKTDDGFV